MTNLFKTPKAPVYTPIAAPQDIPAQPKAPTPAELAAEELKVQKDTKRKYGNSGRAGTVLSNMGGAGGLG